MKKEYCEKCGHSIMKNKHNFSKVLANLLLKAANRFGVLEPFHLQKDLKLSHNEYNNFQKLKYWGLIEKYWCGHKRKGGYWVLKPQAKLLINGRAVPHWLKTYNNEVVESAPEMTSIEDAIGGYEIPVEWAIKAEVMDGLGEPELFKEL